MRDVVAGIGILAELPTIFLIAAAVRRGRRSGWSHAQPESWREEFVLWATVIAGTAGNTLHYAFASKSQSLVRAVLWGAATLVFAQRAAHDVRRARRGEPLRQRGGPSARTQ